MEDCQTNFIYCGIVSIGLHSLKLSWAQPHTTIDWTAMKYYNQAIQETLNNNIKGYVCSCSTTFSSKLEEQLVFWPLYRTKLLQFITSLGWWMELTLVQFGSKQHLIGDPFGLSKSLQPSVNDCALSTFQFFAMDNSLRSFHTHALMTSLTFLQMQASTERLISWQPGAHPGLKLMQTSWDSIADVTLPFYPGTFPIGSHPFFEAFQAIIALKYSPLPSQNILLRRP